MTSSQNFCGGEGVNPKHQLRFKAPHSQRIPIAAAGVAKIFPPLRLATFKPDLKFIHFQFACICPCLKVMLFIPVYLTHRKLNLVPSQPEWVSWYLKLLPHGFSPVVTRDRASAHLSYRQVVLTIRSPSGTAKKKKPFLPGSLSS